MLGIPVLYETLRGFVEMFWLDQQKSAEGIALWAEEEKVF